MLQFIATKNSKMPTPMKKFSSCPQMLHLSSNPSLGIIKAFRAHYTRKLYGTAFEALDASEETTITDYWKSVTIHSVTDYTGTAWDGIKQATINNCWGNVWPDCMKNFEGVTENIKNSIESIMHIAQQ